MAINPHRKGGPDIPIVDGGTGASDGNTALTNMGGLSGATHAVTDHSSIPGVGDLSVGGHSTTDHSGITGVGVAVQRVRAHDGSFIDITGGPTISTVGIPQDTDGSLVVSVGITPTKIGNRLSVRASVQWSGLNNGGVYTTALFVSGSTDAIAANGLYRGTQNLKNTQVEGEFTAASLSPLTFSVRHGPEGGGGSPAINSVNGSPGLAYGGVAGTWIEVVEYYVP
jgi:hypothetical protein